MRLPIPLLVPIIIIAAIAALILLLTIVPLRVFVEYQTPGLLVQIRVLFFRIPIVRREAPEEKRRRIRKKEKKKAKKSLRAEKKRAKKKKSAPTSPQKKKEQRKLLIGLGKKAFAEFTRKNIQVDKLWLDVTLGGAEDPAKTAMMFGGVHAGLGAAWPAVEQFLDIRNRHIRTAVDFNLDATRVDYFCIVIPLPLAKLLSVAIRTVVWLVKEGRTGIKQEQVSEQQQKEAV